MEQVKDESKLDFMNQLIDDMEDIELEPTETFCQRHQERLITVYDKYFSHKPPIVNKQPMKKEDWNDIANGRNMEEADWIIKEDNICPATNEQCEDECCPVGAVCNLKSHVLNKQPMKEGNDIANEKDWDKSLLKEARANAILSKYSISFLNKEYAERVRNAMYEFSDSENQSLPIEEGKDAIEIEIYIDNHTWKAYDKSECDETMLSLFPTRYFKIKLSDKLYQLFKNNQHG